MDKATLLKPEVYQEFEVVRTSGACNMFDKICVLKAARRRKLYSLVAAISGREYGQILKTYSEALEKGLFVRDEG